MPVNVKNNTEFKSLPVNVRNNTEFKSVPVNVRNNTEFKSVPVNVRNTCMCTDKPICKDMCVLKTSYLFVFCSRVYFGKKVV